MPPPMLLNALKNTRSAIAAPPAPRPRPRRRPAIPYHPNPAAIRGIMLPSGDVLFTDTPGNDCPWCELIEMDGCFMHLSCDQRISRPRKRQNATRR
jgi:hypothetical protein